MIGIFSEYVINNQIRVNPITICNNSLHCYQFIQLYIQDRVVPILFEVVPDITIDDDQIALLPTWLQSMFGLKSSVNIKLSPILINNNNHINSNNTKIEFQSIQTNNSSNLNDFRNDFLIKIIKRTLLNKPIIKDIDYMIPILGTEYLFRVKHIDNSNDNNSTLVLNKSHIIEIVEQENDSLISTTQIPIEIQDLEDEIKELTKLIKLKFSNNNSNNNNNILSFMNTKCIAIDGPEGTCKTQLIDFIKELFPLFKFVKIQDLNTVDIIDNSNKEPTILIINNLDSLVGSKQQANDNNQVKKKVQKFCFILDHLQSNQLIISTCKSIEFLDNSLTRAGRIDRFIHLSIPTQLKRVVLFKSILNQTPITSNLSKDQFILELAKITPGFIFKDIIKLVRTAALIASCKESMIMDNIGLDLNDFKEALITVKPSNLVSFDVTIQSTSWDQIGGYQYIKDRFQELIEWPMKHNDTFKRLGLTNSSGVLLHGPSGCGKTLMVKAVASSMNINFISVKGSDIYSKWLGDSEQLVRDLFSRARLSAPCILFFDELDSLAVSRDGDEAGDSGVQQRILSQLLNEMDGIQTKSQIFLLGCTNSIENIDSAMLRPGRFETILQVGLPTLSDRESILGLYCSTMKFENREWISEFAQETQGFTGAQLYHLCNQSGIIQLEKDINSPSISIDSLQECLKHMKSGLL
ncbi:hypothetical protein CYY_005372 [Polysphondylium violaceum]|uniref:AAA+ ATPase domain-containing protein n=1 Tax=Polysphondylium violaceum TaxID=133409 RepID=A0A8J4V6X3_9MYCE|nr:hypothetical protein CYY_005372 [Polysphondylium violaceum]